MMAHSQWLWMQKCNGTPNAWERLNWSLNQDKSDQKVLPNAYKQPLYQNGVESTNW